MPRTINLFGSVALLVSSITGPSLVVIPLLFQQAGWLTPLLGFVTIALLSAAAALFVVETMSSIEGNEGFQASIEFTTIAHLFLGKRWHLVVQALLYLAMQTLVVASLLESFQSMDAFLISVAHKSCAVSFTDGWVCVSQIPPNGSSAFSGHILGSFGTLITISLILPLSLVRLVDNIIFQVVSFIVLVIITIMWIVIFGISGLNTRPVLVVGRDQSTVVGFVLSNFSFVTTVPAWVNNTHPSVNIRLAVWLSVLISCLIYIPVGWLGGLALVIPDSATLLQVFGTDPGHGALSTVARVSSYVFPLAVLITSIPVFTIVIRYNLLRGNICSYKMAVFWSALIPWIIAIPFQTNGGIATILNWASLVFTSPANLLVPFVLFLVSKRHTASAVLDANVSLEPSPAVEVASLAPARPMTAPGGTTSPQENIPVVIITASTDVKPENSEEVKTQVSGESEREVDMLPVTVQNRVLSPSRHRYYGREVVGGTEPSTASGRDCPMLLLDTTGKEAFKRHHNQRRPSLSVSLSPSNSIMHLSNTGMDEFLLISPTPPESRSRSPTVRSVFGRRSPRSSMSPDARTAVSSSRNTGHQRQSSDVLRDAEQGVDVQFSMHPQAIISRCIEEPVLAFQAFPCLAATPVRSTYMSVIGCLIATVLVLMAIVYNIVNSIR